MYTQIKSVYTPQETSNDLRFNVKMSKMLMQPVTAG